MMIVLGVITLQWRTTMPQVNKTRVGNHQSVPLPSTDNDIFARVKPIGFSPDDGLKVLLYGAQGSGKTCFWATFPSPILAIVCSGGISSGELRSVDTPENKKRISEIQLEKSEEIYTLVDGVVQRGYKTIVLDHVSGLTDLIFKEILGLAEIPIQKEFLGKRSQEVYGQLAKEAKGLLAAMLNLRCNVVIIGQERSFGGKDEGFDPEIVKPTIGVATTPAVAGWLAPACDYVLQMFKRGRTRVNKVTVVEGQPPQEIIERLKGVDYCLRCEPSDTYQTKFRIPKNRKPPDVIVDPDYSKLVKAIQGN